MVNWGRLVLKASLIGFKGFTETLGTLKALCRLGV